MTAYTDHDEMAAEAMQIAEDIRETDPVALYRSLSLACARDPERMAQVIMCLAAFLDDQESIGDLTARVEAIAANQVRLRVVRPA